MGHKRGWDTALPGTEHAFSRVTGFAAGRRALEVPGLSAGSACSGAGHFITGNKTAGGRNARACKASHCRSSGCQGEGMCFRKPEEAGNQGRRTVIESICWKRRMHLVAERRLGEKTHAAGTAQCVAESRSPPGPSTGLNSDQPKLLRQVTCGGSQVCAWSSYSFRRLQT